jgi:hypothetical protein
MSFGLVKRFGFLSIRRIEGGWRIRYAVLYPRLYGLETVTLRYFNASMCVGNIRIQHLNIRESSPNLRARCLRVRLLPYGETASRATISPSLRMLYTQPFLTSRPRAC